MAEKEGERRGDEVAERKGVTGGRCQCATSGSFDTVRSHIYFQFCSQSKGRRKGGGKGGDGGEGWWWVV